MQSCDERQSEVPEVVTRDATRDRTADWVLGSPVPTPPSDCPDADDGSDDVELEDSASQRPMSVPSVVGGMPSIKPLATASSAVSRIRMRVGRLVKPVDRLIQNMTQKRIYSAP